MRTPLLETERLILRTFNENDVEDVFYGWETDPDVARYMMWESHNDIERTKSWIEKEIGNIGKDDWYRWALVKKKTGELIGTCLIYYSHDESSYVIGYNISKKFWGYGYTTEAMKEVVQFAREVLKLKELTGAHAVENPSSGNVMKKLGMEYIGECEYICNARKIKTTGKVYKLILN
jgi:[ribosomal protein S5]-alanine N-acetyltransferase